MRAMFAIAAVASIAAALPAQAQAQLSRNPVPFPKSMNEPLPAAYDFTPITATDAQNRPLLIMVSAPRPGSPLPYRAIVASSSTPDFYWNVNFAFDCGARNLGQVDSVKRRWHRGYKADESFPGGEAYRGDFSAQVAPVICDGRGKAVSHDSAKAFEAVRDFIDQPRS